MSEQHLISGHRVLLSALSVAVVVIPSQPKLGAQSAPDVREETVRIQGPIRGMKLGLRHAFRVGSDTPRPTVVVLHGTAVPTAGNADFAIARRSMIASIAEGGFDVWALDFYGFGESDRYPEMDEPAGRHPPLGRVEESVDQVDSVVSFLRHTRGARSVMLIGDSGGSLVAGLFAARFPSAVSRLVLFAPVTPPDSSMSAVQTASTEPIPAYTFVTPQELWSVLTEWSRGAGKPDALDSTMYGRWAAAYLRSDPTSATRTPPSVKIPAGRAADQALVAAGHFLYDPRQITAPTLIVMGESDVVATIPGAERLLKALQHARHRRLVVIGHGSHTVQLEMERTQLYRVLIEFLSESDP
jgi:pimeloyl-ACP methyl ester carboxylesterase